MRRHRDKNRRDTGKVGAALDRGIVRTLRLQIDIKAIVALDDVVFRFAAAGDQHVALNADVHVPGISSAQSLTSAWNTTEYWRRPSSFTTLELVSLAASDGTSRQIIPVCSKTRAGTSIT